MADTRLQVECERWVRDDWMTRTLGQRFLERNVALSSGGQFKFDAVSEDGGIIATISTSQATMSSGKKGVGKLMKLRGDMLFHVLAGERRKLMIFTEPCMYQHVLKERARGRTPLDIEFIHVSLPPQLAEPLSESREQSSREVRPNTGGAGKTSMRSQIMSSGSPGGLAAGVNPRVEDNDASFAAIVPSALIAFAATVEGRRLATRARGAGFSIRVEGRGLEVTPHSSGLGRSISRRTIERVCEEYARTGSMVTAHYQQITVDASYLLTLIYLMRTAE